MQPLINEDIDMSMRAERMEPIAIRGLWCRVPGAESPSEFWRNLCANVVSIAPIPRERLKAIPETTESVLERVGGIGRR